MAAYRYVVHDLRTDAYLGEVPLGDVVWSQRLAGAAETLTASLDMAGGQGGEWREMLRPGRCKITPLRGDSRSTIAGSHILWARSYDGRTLTLRAAGMFSFFSGEYGPDLTATKTYEQVDQFEIVRDLIATGQQGASNIGLQVSSGNSGVLRDRTYHGYEQQRIGHLVNNLSEVENGFDMSVVTTNPDSPTSTLHLHYPRRGRRVAANNLVFTLGQNLRRYQLAEDPPTTVMRAVGAGEAEDMLRASRSDATLLSAGWPTLTQSRSHKTVNQPATLNAWAVADLRTVNANARTWTFELVDPDDESTPLGSWQVGDDARLVIPPDVDWLYPEGLTVDLRIVGQTVKVPDGGGPEEVTLEMGAAFDAQ